YLSFHDPLTGLYNRTYFEKEMSRFENRPDSAVSIIICDVDGLKLVNDTLGHDAGDSLLVAAANVLKESFRPGIVIARVGGDEFAILLPNNNKTRVEDACSRIRDSVARYNVANPKLALNTSIGFAIRTDPSRSMDELFKEADNAMYRQKLHHNESSRSAIVQTLKKALEARDFITDGHAERLKDLVINLARAFGLPERKMADLRLLAQFHDIGKVGIPDSILFKPGPLTPEETSEMHRHCEIGYRIAQSSPDLLPIADWILKHHEWWNGQGYPLGLKGEEIPLECRILAVADAYEAMTSDRPYRRAMSHDEAVAELKRYAGTQFDPQIVDKFLEVQKAIIKSLVLHNHGMLLSSCKQMRY
ncbi:MAG: diguanylate cyclase, partial [Bacillota bacterium]